MLGLRKGEVLGLTWDDVDLDRAELTIGLQLQRVRGRLLHRQTKTEASDATLPLPDICVTALRLRKAAQDRARQAAGPAWSGSRLVFTTRYGDPIEPRNLNRYFAACCARVGVRPITVHDARRTCCDPARRPRRAPARRHARPAARPGRRHDGDLRQSLVHRDPRGAQAPGGEPDA